MIHNGLKRLTVSVLCATLTLAGCSRGTDQPTETERTLQAVEVPLPKIRLLESIQEADNKEFLLRYLSSDCRWNVNNDGGAIVADKRDTVGEGGICPDRNAQLDIRIRFGAYERMRPWLFSAIKEGTVGIVKIQDGPSEVRLPLWEPTGGYDKRVGSWLSLVGEGIGIEITEWSESQDRACTRGALKYLVSELPRIVQLPRGKDDAEYWYRVLPAGSLGDKQDMTVQYEFNEYFVTGFVNAGMKGYVTVRAIDVSGGKKILSEGIQYVGWSADRSIFFPFRVRVGTREVVPRQRLRFEVWSTPVDCDRLIMFQDP